MKTLHPYYGNPEIQAAVDRAVDNYIRARRRKIPGFVRTHFSIAGSARINRKALGVDMVKAPLNLAWAMPYTAVQAGGFLCGRLGLKKIAGLAKKLPPGFKTAVQKEIDRLIFLDLLELPHEQESREPAGDALLAELLDQAEIKALFREELARIYAKSGREGFRPALEKRLGEYAAGRIAVTELAGNIISLAAGAGVLGKMTPGGLSFGTGLAAAIAQYNAISSFALGPTLGGIYYGLFPASASLGLVVASTSAVLAALSVVTAFSGMVTDPVQARLGLHEKRLGRLVDSLAAALKDGNDTGLELRAQYLVRVFDLLDLFRTAANTIV